MCLPTLRGGRRFGSGFSSTDPQNETRKNMNIFAIIGVVVVVLAILGYFGFR